MAFWKEVDKVSVRLAFGWILAPENLIHPLQLSSRAAGSCQEVDVNTFVICQLPRIQPREIDANTIVI